MSKARLEERVAELERQVGALLADHSHEGLGKDWRRTRGAFSGDEVMKEGFAEGRKIREAERERAKAQRPRTRQAR
jgi:hypothetical protein